MFDKIARWTAVQLGRPSAFLAASIGVIIWVLCGFWVGFSDQLYQLAINTVTTIITFLAVFLIQNQQNRDTAALHLKLDELLRATDGARNTMMRVEDLSEAQLAELKRRMGALLGE